MLLICTSHITSLAQLARFHTSSDQNVRMLTEEYVPIVMEIIWARRIGVDNCWNFELEKKGIVEGE